MKFLAISGSARMASTNTALLRAVAQMAPQGMQIEVFDGLARLPVFSPDLEAAPLPQMVQGFADQIAQSDGLIIASPEYVRAIPGGLKNAIDWLVSRPEIIGKPVALIHGSHRGDDMLAQLRLVLSTVSERFAPEPFLRFDVLKHSPEEIAALLQQPEARQKVERFLSEFAGRCRAGLV
ncbi:NADPH-dependent FMN reductase [Phaeobacter sp. HF9A]|uniref:NADPH-dependent FMN reductase n=1 Tax=Phaeobacter sp. HF9A TaxID=2721561 RepID=UPI00142F9814|nr:NADPH-dependent FMN reductase [Phaeobacter sp. HF9A]NIZ14791.1 NAD(P)H-dependent oxidoreductase [Phaeobacter sp. HF9A]